MAGLSSSQCCIRHGREGGDVGDGDECQEILGQNGGEAHEERLEYRTEQQSPTLSNNTMKE